MNIARNSKGFTLIEIVIVIAIAALILAAVLLFIPQAQKSQRDGQRKNDAAKILAKFNECAGNNAGNYTACTPAIMTANYMSGIKAPGGSAYALSNTNPTCTSTPNLNVGLVLSNSNTTATVTLCLEGTGGSYSVNN